MRERPDNAVLTCDEVLCSTWRHVYVPEKIQKAVYSAVDALRCLCKPVSIREIPDNTVLTSEEVL